MDSWRWTAGDGASCQPGERGAAAASHLTPGCCRVGRQSLSLWCPHPISKVTLMELLFFKKMRAARRRVSQRQDNTFDVPSCAKPLHGVRETGLHALFCADPSVMHFSPDREVCARRLSELLSQWGGRGGQRTEGERFSDSESL